eukprot:189205_1
MERRRSRRLAQRQEEKDEDHSSEDDESSEDASMAHSDASMENSDGEKYVYFNWADAPKDDVDAYYVTEEFATKDLWMITKNIKTDAKKGKFALSDFLVLGEMLQSGHVFPYGTGSGFDGREKNV